MKPGIYRNLPFAEYEEIDALNWSTLSKMLISPAECKRYMEKPPESSAAQDFGTAVHTYLLERSTFNDRYAVFDGTRRGKAWESFQADNGHRSIITASEFEQIKIYGLRWNTHPLTKDLLKGADTELTLVWELHGALCKGRVDLIKDATVWDVKTTRCGNPSDFVLDASSMFYQSQLDFYALGASILEEYGGFTTGIIACSKAKDALDPIMVFHGAPKFSQTDPASVVLQFLECKANNHWPEADVPAYDENRPFCLHTGEQL